MPVSSRMKLGIFLTAGVLILLAMGTLAPAQPDSTAHRRGTYAVVLTAGGGMSYYVPHVGVPPGLGDVTINRLGLPATVRAMWYPDHRLRVGLETGWTRLYAYRGRITDQRARVGVSAVPILLVFAMPIGWLSEASYGIIGRNVVRRLSVTAGTGVYRIHSRLNYLGQVDAARSSLSWMVAGSYTQPINRRFQVATELKWYNATATENAVLTLQLQAVWRALSW